MFPRWGKHFLVVIAKVGFPFAALATLGVPLAQELGQTADAHVFAARLLVVLLRTPRKKASRWRLGTKQIVYSPPSLAP